MPKIIENLQSRLISEAREQVKKGGYSAMTVRSVAKACGVGIGTVYNYFPSKDALLAHMILEDWKRCTDVIEAVSDSALLPEPVAQCIHAQLCGFVQLHSNVFFDEAAAAAFSGSFSRYHGMLRSQLAKPLRKFCTDDFAAEFIAEALLTWTMAGKEFQEIYGMIEKLFCCAAI